MGRVKKGNRVQRKDLWAMAGGIETLVRTMKRVNITKRDTGYSSEIWSELSITLFGQDHKQNRHWLWVIWIGNRNGVRDLINKQQEKSLEINEAQVKEKKISDCETKEVKEEQADIDEDSHKNEEEDKHQMSLQREVQVKQADTYEDLQKNEEEDKHQKMSLQKGAQPKNGNTKQWRKLPVVSKRFTITVDRKKWQKIVPLADSTKLRQPWTNILHNSFRKKNPCCTLAFKSQHVKTPHSRKINSPYLNISAVCTFPSCSAKYSFKRKREPVGDTLVKIFVLQKGQIAHKTSKRQFRVRRTGNKSEVIEYFCQ